MKEIAHAHKHKSQSVVTVHSNMDFVVGIFVSARLFIYRVSSVKRLMTQKLNLMENI